MRLATIFIFFLCISCNKDLSNNEIANYLKQDLEINFSNNHSLFIILPLTACSSCIDSTKEFLLSQHHKISDNVSIILLAYDDYSLNSYSENLKEHYSIYHDKTGKGFKKRFLNESSPLLVVFEKGKVSSFNFNINNLDKMKNEVLNFK